MPRDPVFVPFAEYLPDRPALRNPGSTNIKNVIPYLDGSYLPFYALSNSIAALTARVRGAIAVRASDAAAVIYTGDATKLYEITNASATPVDASGATYTLGSEDNWNFVKWGDKVIATSFTDSPQVITIGTGAGGSNFAALGGTPPKARHIAVVQDFVVLANLDESGTLTPNKVRWSGVNNEATWTASASTLSDSQTLEAPADYGGGWIMAMKGGEYGVIFQEFCIWRMSYSGSPFVFNFDPVLPGKGTPARNSVVQHGNLIFYLGQAGFEMLINGVQVEEIGFGKVDKTFLADLDSTYPHMVIGAIDPISRVVAWIYPGAGSSGGTPNKILFYNYLTKRWTTGDLDAEWLFPGIGQGYTLDGLDAISASLDSLPASLDSRLYVEGTIQLSGADTSHRIGAFTGSAKAATLETAESQIFPGRSAHVNGVRPVVRGDSVTATVAAITRNLQNAAATTGSAISTNTETGIAHVRSEARYHRLQVVTSGDFEHAIGVDIYAKPTSGR